MSPTKTVFCPEMFEPIFEKAEKFVSEAFKEKTFSPETGSITIGGERYILIRAKSMSYHLFEFIKAMNPNPDEAKSLYATSNVLFDMAKSIGRSDAKAFHLKTNAKDPVEKLSTGPVHFAHTGWANVKILKESQPSLDENFLLIYEHPCSFEAEAWMQMGARTNHHVCFLNAGYSSGWCSESFSLDLVAKEISCRAKGDRECQFIMAPPAKIDVRIFEFLSKAKGY